MIAFCEDALLWRGHEDLRDGVEENECEGFESREGVTEVHQGRDEDQDVEDD